jgi:hypothetical protein
VYSSLNNVSDALRLYTNPAVIGTLTDDEWIQKFEKLKSKYISSGASAPPDPTATPINPLFLKPCIVLIVFIFANAILTGELGPGLPTRWRATAALRHFLSAPPGADEDTDGAQAEEANGHVRSSEAELKVAAGDHRGKAPDDDAPSEMLIAHAELLVTLLAPLLAELREVKADVQGLKNALKPPGGRASSGLSSR